MCFLDFRTLEVTKILNLFMTLYSVFIRKLILIPLNLLKLIRLPCFERLREGCRESVMGNGFGRKCCQFPCFLLSFTHIGWIGFV